MERGKRYRNSSVGNKQEWTEGGGQGSETNGTKGRDLPECGRILTLPPSFGRSSRAAGADRSAGVAEGTPYCTTIMSGAVRSKVDEARARREAVEWEVREAEAEEACLAEEEQKKAEEEERKKATLAKVKATAEAKAAVEAKAAAEAKAKAAAEAKAALEERIRADPANLP